MPSNQDQNTRQNFYMLPITVLSSAKAFYAFDDGGDDNLEALFAHVSIRGKVVLFLSNLESYFYRTQVQILSFRLFP